jgi:DNA-binding response OmpR family regulator
VLVVEADPTLRGVLTAVLTLSGLRAAGAADLTAAEAAVRAAPPEAALVDTTTGADGAAAALLLRAAVPDLPVLFLATRAEPRAAAPGGADHYLAVPFDLRQVVARLQALLAARPDRAVPAPRSGAPAGSGADSALSA